MDNATALLCQTVAQAVLDTLAQHSATRNWEGVYARVGDPETVPTPAPWLKDDGSGEYRLTSYGSEPRADLFLVRHAGQEAIELQVRFSTSGAQIVTFTPTTEMPLEPTIYRKLLEAFRGTEQSPETAPDEIDPSQQVTRHDIAPVVQPQARGPRRH